MYQDYSPKVGQLGGGMGQLGGIAAMANALGNTQCTPCPTIRETVPSIIESILQQACELRNSCGMVADNLSGPQPCDSSCKPPEPNAIMDRLLAIRSVLSEALYSQRRVTETLSL